jgi:hypothetical protein
MGTSESASNIDYRLLGFLSDLVICSKCLRAGRVTPVPQILSPRHTPRSLCAGCVKPRRRNLRNVLRWLLPV